MFHYNTFRQQENLFQSLCLLVLIHNDFLDHCRDIITNWIVFPALNCIFMRRNSYSWSFPYEEVFCAPLSLRRRRSPLSDKVVVLSLSEVPRSPTRFDIDHIIVAENLLWAFLKRLKFLCFGKIHVLSCFSILNDEWRFSWAHLARTECHFSFRFVL